MKTALFRVDASSQIGSGHVMRCLTFAEQIVDEGGKAFFICREHDGNLCTEIEKKGYIVYRLPIINDKVKDHSNRYNGWLGATIEEDAQDCVKIVEQLAEIGESIDFVVVDHYSIDAQWENKIKKYVNNIVVIDDLANRFHECNVLIDQNIYQNSDNRYITKTLKDCILLLGPKYALLRKEFIEARKKSKIRKSIKRIFIFYGGVDSTNETVKALHAIKLCIVNIKENLIIDVVCGKANPNKEAIQNMCKEINNCSYYENIDNIAELMTKADIALGAGGTTTWERCSLGLPSLTTIIAENQREVVENAAKCNLLVNLGYCTEVKAEDIAKEIEILYNKPDKLEMLSKNSSELFSSQNKNTYNAMLIYL